MRESDGIAIAATATQEWRAPADVPKDAERPGPSAAWAAVVRRLRAWWQDEDQQREQLILPPLF